MLKFIFIFIFIAVQVHAITRIMPFGDSITFDDRHNENRPVGLRTGYRSHLDHLLKDNNFTFDFVGSVRSGQDVQPPFDPDNEGHPGENNAYLASHVYDFLSINPADMMLIHAGTNHHNNLDYEINSMIKMLNEIDRYESDSHTSIRVILALIIPRANDVLIPKYNNALATLAHDRIAKGDNIILVDMENDANLSWAEDYHDGTHPNDQGYAKMAQVWLPAILTKRKDKLYLYPITLVNRAYIINASINETSNSVTFSTTIPDNGIQF